MLNQSAVEALYSATYVEDYLDSVENMPDDVMKFVTRMKEMDLATVNYIKDLEESLGRLLELQEDPSDESNEEFQNLSKRVQGILLGYQDLGDQKLHVVQQIQDYTETRARQLEVDKNNLDSVRTSTDGGGPPVATTSSKSSPDVRSMKRARRIRPEVYVQSMTSSILGPPTLSATAYREDGRGETELDPLHLHAPPPSRTAHQTALAKLQAAFSSISYPAATSSSATSSGTFHHPPDKSSSSSLGMMGGGAERKSLDLAIPSTSTSTSSTIKKYIQEKTRQQDPERRKYNRRKSTKQTEKAPVNLPIDPDEPTYCLCDQVSYGEMIGCDNDLCPIEWFHFNCVSLVSKPKGKWYCPKCRGDKPNVMKPKSLLFKELEKYNREKEEKA